MYVGVGDAGTGEQRDIRRLNPQRLDTLDGKILRIVPDLREHTADQHGERERPLPHPERQPVRRGRRRAQGDLGRGPAQSASPDLGRRSRAAAARRACSRSTSASPRGRRWSSSRRARTTATRCAKAPQAMTPQGMTPVPADDTIPRADHRHRHARHGQADLSGDRLPARRQRRRRDRRRVRLSRHAGSRRCKGKLVFGDITTGRIWYAEMADVLQADDGNPTTLAPMHELETGLRRLVEADLPRARRPGRRLARRRRRRRPRPRRRALRRGQRRRALPADEEPTA